MYTKQEESKHKQAFWTTFGQYMQPALSADGVKTNWINYKTGIAGIHFKMDAGNRQASIAIVLSHSDPNVRQFHYDQFLLLRTMLHDTLGEVWRWQPNAENEYGKIQGIISRELPNININRTEDWPLLISFFKPRIMALDAFWSNTKYGFEP